MRKHYRALWTFTVPGCAFFSVSGKWFHKLTDADWAAERARRSPKHSAWSSNWLDVKLKRTVLRMAKRSPTGYAVFRKYKRVRGEWRMAEWHYAAPNATGPHPAGSWFAHVDPKPLTPRERMKRRK